MRQRDGEEKDNASPQRTQRIRKGREGNLTARSAIEPSACTRAKNSLGASHPKNKTLRPSRILCVLCGEAFFFTASLPHCVPARLTASCAAARSSSAVPTDLNSVISSGPPRPGQLPRERP